jgi:hypothetical protein
MPLMSRLHDQPGWDMHDRGAEIRRPAEDRLQPGTRVGAIVVCHHPFGMGVYIEERAEYGHVDIPFIAPGRLRGPEDFPPIGSQVDATVSGYTAIDGQLRLYVYRATSGHAS